jgi:hypothetical protein
MATEFVTGVTPFGVFETMRAQACFRDFTAKAVSVTIRSTVDALLLAMNTVAISRSFAASTITSAISRAIKALRHLALFAQTLPWGDTAVARPSTIRSTLRALLDALEAGVARERANTAITSIVVTTVMAYQTGSPVERVMHNTAIANNIRVVNPDKLTTVTLTHTIMDDTIIATAEILANACRIDNSSHLIL